LKWRLNSRSTRTFGGPIIKLRHVLSVIPSDSKIKKTFRNPIIYALELADEMKSEGLNQVELAQKHGVSRARVNQWLSLLRLPAGEKRRIIAMGDNWERRLLTERSFRKHIEHN